MLFWLMSGTICLLITIVLWVIDVENWVAVGLVCAVLCGMASCSESDWWKRSEKEKAEIARKAATPHVIREADGCKVYAFTTDREHYFTRCGNTVTTETNWNEYCGKSCTKHMSDTITTEGNK